MNGRYDVSCWTSSLVEISRDSSPNEQTYGTHEVLEDPPIPHASLMSCDTDHSASSLIFACSASTCACSFARWAFCMNRRLKVPLLRVFPDIAASKN